MNERLSNLALRTAHHPSKPQDDAVTPASDLYSIGIILYELLTERLPFEGQTITAIVLKQLTERPVRRVPLRSRTGNATPTLRGDVQPDRAAIASQLAA